MAPGICRLLNRFRLYWPTRPSAPRRVAMPRDTCVWMRYLELLAAALRSLARSPEMSDAQGEELGQIAETCLGPPMREAFKSLLGRCCARCKTLSHWFPYKLLPSCLMRYPKDLAILFST